MQLIFKRHQRDVSGDKRVRRQGGYTLIELAVSFAVIGFLMASFLTAYNLYQKNEIRQRTENNVIRITAALTNFLIQNGRYPCPARLDALRTDVDYGLEGVCDPTDGAYPVVVTGSCAGGYCFEEGQRLVDIDPDPGVTVNVNPVVRRGAVPFRVLGLTENQAEDGYYNRLQYAVTENLAVTETYIAESGGIGIISAAGDSMVRPDDSAHFVIFSTGPDRQGAYSHEGILINSCASGTGIDTENCNTSAANDEAVYALADYSLEQGANNYDDFLKYYSSVEQPLWRVADANGFHIRDLIDAEAGGRVGIGTGSPNEALDVGSGDVLADGGNLMVNDVCDPGGNNCFNVAKFGDPTGDPDFTCSVANGGAYAVGFSSGKIICSDTAQVRCPSGSIMEGINPDGSLDCRAVNGCPSQNVQLCWNSGTGSYDIHNLPPSLPETYIWTNVSGISYQERWRCRSWGAWRRVATTGLCSCTPINETDTYSCNSLIGPGNWTGTVDYNHTVTCPDNTETWTAVGDVDTDCMCSPTTETDVDSCPSGFTGNITNQRDWVCEDSGGSPCTAYDGGNCGRWTNWVVTSDTCTCVPDTQTQNFSCPTAYTGTIVKHRDFECPAGTWTGWIEDSNTCTCTGASQTQVVGCTSPLVGNITQQRDYDCGSDTWGAWYEIANTCGAVTYSYRNKSTQNGPFGGPLSVSVGDSCSTPGNTVACSTPAGGGQYWHYDVCECE